MVRNSRRYGNARAQLQRNENLRNVVTLPKQKIQTRQFLRSECLMFSPLHFNWIARHNSNTKNNRINPMKSGNSLSPTTQKIRQCKYGGDVKISKRQENPRVV